VTALHEVVESSRVPQRGPYSQAVRLGELLFLAGQAGLDPSRGHWPAPRLSSKRAGPLKTSGRSSRTRAAVWIVLRRGHCGRSSAAGHRLTRMQPTNAGRA
jgi:hypothetical protein